MRETDPMLDHAAMRQLAHELRNCLATLRSATHLLNKAATRPHLLPQIKEAVERAVDNMASLIETSLTPADSAAAGPAGEVATGEAVRRILIADDNRDAAMSLAMVLGLEGYEVAIAHDGNEALALAQAKQPNVMLLDLQMPLKDGAQVAREIRTQQWASGCKLIAVTGWSRQEDEATIRAAGFDAQMRKPVDVDALIRLL